VPWFIEGHRAGSVAFEHLQALSLWHPWLVLRDGALHLQAAAGAPRNHVLEQINHALKAQGLVRGWRHETYAVTRLDTDEGPGLRPPAGVAPPLALIERAAARFWGSLTLGAHATGYVADAAGRPTHLWLARRARSKATDPGLWDNLVGGGVPAGQTPWQALLREGWEEAGLDDAMTRRATSGRVIRLQREVAGGLQLENLYSHDLQLPPSWAPCNQDGEVAAFDCLPVSEALQLATSSQMTVDASLVTLDFALRHGLCAEPPGWAAVLAAR
jgi:8-oxo-dGTP pyrophosphatase MutT (NUDIX family)